MMGVVGASLAVFSWLEEEEESDLGQFADCLLSVCAVLVGGVHGLEDRERDWADSRW